MTAFDYGYEAFLRGEGDRENPYGYEYQPEAFDEWLNGWCAAARDHEEGR